MEGQFIHCLIEVSKAPSLLANIKTIALVLHLTILTKTNHRKTMKATTFGV